MLYLKAAMVVLESYWYAELSASIDQITACWNNAVVERFCGSMRLLKVSKLTCIYMLGGCRQIHEV